MIKKLKNAGFHLVSVISYMDSLQMHSQDSRKLVAQLSILDICRGPDWWKVFKINIKSYSDENIIKSYPS